MNHHFKFTSSIKYLIVATLLLGGIYLRMTPTSSPDTSIDAQTVRVSASPASSQSPQTSLRNIEDIRAGDTVLARDPSTGQTAPREVVQVFRRTSLHLRHLTILTANGRIANIETTDEHPFFADAEEINAGDLTIGMQLDGLGSDTAGTLIATRYEAHPEGITVHNFEVEGFHTYFVTAKTGDKTPLWVHNASCGSGSLAGQAAELVPLNGGKHRVTMRSPSQQVEIDLVGRPHGGVPTPHTKSSPRNSFAPNQPAYNTKNTPTVAATQSDIRTARRYLESQQ